MKNKFYEFTQNNSGGVFFVDHNLCHRIIIEAYTYHEAEEKAISLGVYFNGVKEEIDCSCCGDRWDSSDEINLESASISSKQNFSNIKEYAQFLANTYGYTYPDIRIFYMDGRMDEIFTNI